MNRLRRISRFFRDVSGSMTVEAVIWLPIFTVCIALIIDIASIYKNKSEVAALIQTANRAYSTGEFMNETELANFVRASLVQVSASPTVNVTLAADEFTTRVVLNTSDLMPIGVLIVLKDRPVNVSYSHYRGW
jgi:Flp pilus assembly protein TadG